MGNAERQGKRKMNKVLRILNENGKRKMKIIRRGRSLMKKVLKRK